MMKDSREAYEQLSQRLSSLLAAIANGLQKAEAEKLRGMEGNTNKLLMYVESLFTLCSRG
jgi:hypothetical protein